MNIDGAWDATETQQFLQDALIPLRVSCHHPSGGLWMVSLWYRYDGQFQCATAMRSDVARFLRRDGSVAFEVSTNRPPYMGVRGNGHASLAPDEDKTVLRSLLERYLGNTENALATTLLAGDREEVVITIDPARLYTWDFSARMDRETPANRWRPSSPQQ